jgi:hypothetical protein
MFLREEVGEREERRVLRWGRVVRVLHHSHNRHHHQGQRMAAGRMEQGLSSFMLVFSPFFYYYFS